MSADLIDFLQVFLGPPLFGSALLLFLLLSPQIPLIHSIIFAIGLILLFIGISNSFKEIYLTFKKTKKQEES